MTDRSPSGSLPYGWKVKTSRRYPDRVYYFNFLTHLSTWECPELDPPREIAVEDKKLSSLSKNESANENTQLPKEVLKNLPEIKVSKKKCVPKDIKVSETLPDINEKIKGKCDLSESNSVKKFLKEHSQEQKHSIVESAKCNIAHTAPLVLERKEDNKKVTVSKSADTLKKDNSRKRIHDEGLSSSCDNPSALPMKIKSLKKIKISPLNRTEFEQKKCPSDQIMQKEEKKLTDSSSYSSNTSSVEIAEKWSSESSFNIEDNKDGDDIEIDVAKTAVDDFVAKMETVFNTFANYVIIIDTNVLIDDLSLIKEIKDIPLGGCGPPHLLIPYIVLEELDKLKVQRGVKSCCNQPASDAIRYLNSVLNVHPRIHGQSAADVERWAKTYSKLNDDRLLECCWALADKMPREKVILLTHDKNLSNKASTSNIVVHNPSSLIKFVKPDVAFTYSNRKNKKSKKRSESGTSESVRSLSGASNINQSPTVSSLMKDLISKQAAYKQEIKCIMCKAQQLLKDALVKFLEKEMEEAYGAIWLSFPIQRDLLKGILEGINKYWAVFPFMSAKDKRNFELLKEKVSQLAGFWGDKQDCLAILPIMEDVIAKVKERNTSVNISMTVFHHFQIACQDLFSKYCDVESAIQTIEQESTLKVFEQNWVVINQLSGIILDFCKLPHDFQYDKPDALPSESDIRRLICNLYPAVQHLKAEMFKMLDAVRKSQPMKKIMHTLAAALLNFCPSLDIPYEQVSLPGFSAAALEIFCTRPQNRDMIENGCMQIEKFCSKLHESLKMIKLSKF